MQANSRAYFLLIAIISFGLVGFALYLQFEKGYQPCPLCIMQRFAFIGIGLFSLLAAIAQNTRSLWQGLGMLSGVGGIAVAVYHVSLLLNPKASCGIDPLENWVNALPTARCCRRCSIRMGCAPRRCRLCSACRCQPGR